MGGNFSAYQRWLRGMWVKLPPYRHGTDAHARLQCFAKQVRGQIKTEFAVVGKIIAQTFTVFGRSLQKSCGSCRVASCNKKRVRVCNVNKSILSPPYDIKQRNNLPSQNTESQSKRHCCRLGKLCKYSALQWWRFSRNCRNDSSALEMEAFHEWEEFLAKKWVIEALRNNQIMINLSRVSWFSSLFSVVIMITTEISKLKMRSENFLHRQSWTSA